jgi:hypothetical protein
MKMNLRQRQVLLLIVTPLLLLSWFNLSGCGGNSSAATDPQADYLVAVQDALTLTVAKISKNLTPVRPENGNLQWENSIVGSRVLVATYIENQAACENYNNQTTGGCKAGQECPAYWYNSWVTVVPELRNLLGSSPTLLRLAQALGLPPPGSGKTLTNTCILELYVSPANLFRPSADPEITDQEAELSFPSDGFRKYDDTVLVYSDMPCDNAFCSSCTSSGKCGMTNYRNWFAVRRTYIYSLATPYPWTALGYTYDWGNPVAPHIGVSEFVINAGSSGIPVFIKSVKWTADYFNSH